MHIINTHLATIALAQYRGETEDSPGDIEIMASSLEKFVAQEVRLQALVEKLLREAAADGVTPDGGYYIDSEEVATSHGLLLAAQELQEILS